VLPFLQAGLSVQVRHAGPDAGGAGVSDSTSWRSEAAPAWFREAVELPTRSHYVSSSGARIHFLSWNDDERDKPGLLFLHGFRGHARWWSFIAPYFRERYRVYALDFSGMGESEARSHYDPLDFALDIAAVIEDRGLTPATLVAHSFGGSRAMRLCAERPELVKHAVIVDSYVHFLEPKEQRPVVVTGPRKLYASYEAAKARYRLTPPEHAAADYVFDYIAHHSLEAHEGGYRWKFADNLSTGLMELDGAAVLRRIQVPLTYMHGELSRVAEAGRARRIVDHIAGARGPIAIPQAHHHVLLDQPLSLVAALRGALY
jgi:pimeloyl-ACP methyl ester carboxylesterase